jgi:hypothetical protein
LVNKLTNVLNKMTCLMSGFCIILGIASASEVTGGR